MTSLLKSIVPATALAVSVMLSGCGGFDGVELNGKVFDALGISSSALASGNKEPKLASRAPLVLPPDTARLPAPGVDATGAPDVALQLNDPERKRLAALAERERLHKAYCSGEMTWKERAQGKPGYQADEAQKSPYGACGAFGDGLNNIGKN
jgi:hypothetical protein